MEKLILYGSRVSVRIDYTTQISFHFEEPDENAFREYERLLTEWMENINKNLSVQIRMGNYSNFACYGFGFNFSFRSLEGDSYNEIEGWISELFSIINSISKIEKPSKFIDEFVDKFLSGEIDFENSVDSMYFLWGKKYNKYEEKKMYESGTKIFEIFRNNVHKLFRHTLFDNDAAMKLYLQEKLGL